MKKLILIAIGILFSIASFSQAKKPTIMVLPSDQWCIQNGFFTQSADGEQHADYRKAFLKSADLKLATAKINEMMVDRGFPLVSAEALIKNINFENAERSLSSSSASGAGLAESPKDMLLRAAKSDIVMELGWTINKTGPKQSLTFILEGLDSYTNKSIAGASGTGTPSFSAEIPVLLEESILSHLDDFNGRLQAHFDDMFANGREVVLSVRVWEDSPVNLESEILGDELSFLIEDWIYKNAVQGRYGAVNVSATNMSIQQIRIPMFDANNRALDTRNWARGLQKFLRDTYSIDAKLETIGLGKAVITLGSK
ncbi:MAG: DUF6175 family protein [Rikenellaceae bacterium]